MQLVRDGASAAALGDAGMRMLIEQRFAALRADEAEDLCYFIVVEEGDKAEQLGEHLGFSILHSRLDDLRFDEPAFHRSWEVLEEHPSCYEMVIVLSDDGAGVEILIPKVPGIDPDLMALCRRYATRAQEPAA